MLNMRITILPKSALGWWSVGLCVAFFLFFGLGEEIWSLNNYSSVVLDHTITIITMGIAAAAFVTGLISIVKRKQGAILVFLSTAIGLAIMIGVSFEFRNWVK